MTPYTYAQSPTHPYIYCIYDIYALKGPQVSWQNVMSKKKQTCNTKQDFLYFPLGKWWLLAWWILKRLAVFLLYFVGRISKGLRKKKQKYGCVGVGVQAMYLSIYKSLGNFTKQKKKIPHEKHKEIYDTRKKGHHVSFLVIFGISLNMYKFLLNMDELYGWRMCDKYQGQFASPLWASFFLLLRDINCMVLSE